MDVVYSPVMYGLLFTVVYVVPSYQRMVLAETSREAGSARSVRNSNVKGSLATLRMRFRSEHE
jgi:predicted transcriptional regulator with HTH domain